MSRVTRPPARARVRAPLAPLALLVLALVLLAAPAAYAEHGDPGGHCYGTGGPIVVLDPGHGGGDAGTSNSAYGLVEKDLTLDVALRARDLLVASGYRVCLTRIGDVGLTNRQRSDYANAVGGQALVLIHFNAVGQTGSADTTNYTRTYWGKRNKDLAFARTMHDAFYPALATNYDGTPVFLTDGGVGQFATRALLDGRMPATLAEIVFLSNNAEAQRLADAGAPSRRQQIAQAITSGIMNWFN
ncbi:MAG TPA: N-acetylmuramoyl-L-alanine amidase [Roseiflexaceae bacterium]|nr:N-acetylmuramoyl-L-alanine amidase [Roseiflexaceae bacterium]